MALRKNLDKSNWSLILRDQTVEREGKRKREKKRKRKRRRKGDQKGMKLTLSMDSSMDRMELCIDLYGYMIFVWILVRFCPKIYLGMDF